MYRLRIFAGPPIYYQVTSYLRLLALSMLTCSPNMNFIARLVSDNSSLEKMSWGHCPSQLSLRKQEAPLTPRGQRGRCRNIKGELYKYGSFHSPRPSTLFPLGVILWWALANPSCVPNLKSLASAVAEILKGKPQISGSSPSPGPLFLLVGFDGPWQTQLHARFEVAGFFYYGNIRESVFKRQIRFLSHPLGSWG